MTLNIKNFMEKVKNKNFAYLKEQYLEILNSNNAEMLFLYADMVPHAPIKELETTLINTLDAKYIFLFAKYIKSANIAKLSKAILLTNDINYIIQFAAEIKISDFNSFTNYFIHKTFIREIYDYIYEVTIKHNNELNINYILDFLLHLSNCEAILINLTKIRDDINLNSITEYIISYGNPKYIYELALNTNIANQQKVKAALIKTNNIYYLKKYSDEIANNKDIELNNYINKLINQIYKIEEENKVLIGTYSSSYNIDELFLNNFIKESLNNGFVCTYYSYHGLFPKSLIYKYLKLQRNYDFLTILNIYLPFFIKDIPESVALQLDELYYNAFRSGKVINYIYHR